MEITIIWNCLNSPLHSKINLWTINYHYKLQKLSRVCVCALIFLVFWWGLFAWKKFGTICHFGPFWANFSIFIFCKLLIYEFSNNDKDFSITMHLKVYAKTFELTTFWMSFRLFEVKMWHFYNFLDFFKFRVIKGFSLTTEQMTV